MNYERALVRFKGTSIETRETVYGSYVFLAKATGFCGQMLTEWSNDRHVIMNTKGKKTEIIPETLEQIKEL
jgi:hypothetical protein